MTRLADWILTTLKVNAWALSAVVIGMVGTVGAIVYLRITLQPLPEATVWDGWGASLFSSVLFGVVWAIAFYVLTSKHPARKRVRRSIQLIGKELAQNFRIIASRDRKLLALLGTGLYEQYRGEVLLSLSKDACDGLMYLYETFGAIKRYPYDPMDPGDDPLQVFDKANATKMLEQFTKGTSILVSKDEARQLCGLLARLWPIEGRQDTLETT